MAMKRRHDDVCVCHVSHQRHPWCLLTIIQKMQLFQQ